MTTLQPWLTEPPTPFWGTHREIPYVLLRHPTNGHLRGYVGLGFPPTIDSESLQVHGGINYEQPTLPQGIPSPEGTAYWLGFDAAHSGDFLPAHPELGGIYRGVDYMETQCRALIDQILDQGQPACTSCAHWRRGHRSKGPGGWSWTESGPWGLCFGVPPRSMQEDEESFPCTHEQDRCPNYRS